MKFCWRSDDTCVDVGRLKIGMVSIRLSCTVVPPAGIHRTTIKIKEFYIIYIFSFHKKLFCERRRLSGYVADKSDAPYCNIMQWLLSGLPLQFFLYIL